MFLQVNLPGFEDHFRLASSGEVIFLLVLQYLFQVWLGRFLLSYFITVMVFGGWSSWFLYLTFVFW